MKNMCHTNLFTKFFSFAAAVHRDLEGPVVVSDSRRDGNNGNPSHCSTFIVMITFNWDFRGYMKERSTPYCKFFVLLLSSLVLCSFAIVISKKSNHILYIGLSTIWLSPFGSRGCIMCMCGLLFACCWNWWERVWKLYVGLEALESQT